MSPWYQDNAVQGIPASLECTEVLSSKNRMHSGSPSTPVHSATDSAHSEELGSAVVSEETLGEYHVSCTGETAVQILFCRLRLTCETSPTNELLYTYTYVCVYGCIYIYICILGPNKFF